MRQFKRNPLKSSETGLGAVAFDHETGRLRDASGREIPLRHRSREVLRCLWRHRNQVVTRAALIEAAWEVRNVSDDNVAQCIADIRRALSDHHKRILETVPRLGYRLLVPSNDRDPEVNAKPIPNCPAGAPPSPPPARGPVIAVEPFDDFSFSRALPSAFRNVLLEAMVTDLARYPELTVLARRSQNARGDSGPADRTLAQSSTDYLITGAFTSDGTRVRVSARLVSCEDMSYVWIDEFDFDLSELLALTRSVGRQVASCVGARLIDLAEHRLDRGHVTAMFIENAARSRMLRFGSADAFHRNIRDQEVALKRFPDAAWGNFGQALAIRTGIDNGWLFEGVEAAEDRAEKLAARALALDPNNYLSHYALGRVLQGTGDMDRALGAFEHAVRLNPSSAMILQGMIIPTLNLGRTTRALELIDQCRKIEPRRGRNLSFLEAWTHWQIGAPEEALRSLLAAPDRTVEQAKLLAVVRLELGQSRMAHDALTPFRVVHPDWTLRREAKVQRARGTPEHLAERWLRGLSVLEVAP